MVVLNICILRSVTIKIWVGTNTKSLLCKCNHFALNVGRKCRQIVDTFPPTYIILYATQKRRQIVDAFCLTHFALYSALKCRHIVDAFDPIHYVPYGYESVDGMSRHAA